jgi:hypothetical protein
VDFEELPSQLLAGAIFWANTWITLFCPQKCLRILQWHSWCQQWLQQFHKTWRCHQEVLLHAVKANASGCVWVWETKLHTVAKSSIECFRNQDSQNIIL